MINPLDLEFLERHARAYALRWQDRHELTPGHVDAYGRHYLDAARLNEAEDPGSEWPTHTETFPQWLATR